MKKLIEYVVKRLPISRRRVDYVLTAYEVSQKQNAEIIRSLIEEMSKLTKLITEQLGVKPGTPPGDTPPKKDNDQMFG